MIKFFISLCGTLFLFTRPILCDETCKFSLEVLLLQDGSGSFKDHIDNMTKVMDSLVSRMQATYDGVKLGVSSFVDKPIPLRGAGPYGNSQSAADYCYRSHASLSENAREVVHGLTTLAADLGSGNDFPENPMEGLIIAAADPSVGWSAPDVKYSPSGSPLVRLILLITDDIPHFPDDADSAINNFWHYPRSYNDPSAPMNSTGGFGAHDFTKWNGAITIENAKDREDYEEMADLFALLDHKKVLTSEQQARHAALIKKFGPYPMKEVVPYPGDSSIQCEETEYPTIADVSINLKKADIHPIFLLAEALWMATEQTRACNAIGMQPGKDCLATLYGTWSTEMGFSPVSLPITGTNIETTILDAIQGMTDRLCLESTTTPSPTNSGESTTTSSPINPQDPSAETSTAQADDRTTSNEQTSSATTPADDSQTTDSTSKTLSTSKTEDLVSTQAGESTDRTASATTSTDEVTEETGARVYPLPPMAPNKSNIALIAGATGGAAAGVVAVAGALYAKFGAAFSHSPISDMAGMQQVDTPDDPVEREIMEEVTIDLFQ